MRPLTLGSRSGFVVVVVLLTAACALAALAAGGQPPPPAPSNPPGVRSLGPCGPGTELVALSNGVKVVLLEAHSNPMVASSVTVLAGVRNETPATNGATHFLEHLLFDGTTSRTQEQLYKDADAIGGYNNATTRDEYTLFQFLVHRDHLATALDIQSDMLLRSTIPESAFEKERKIVLEELARDSSDPGYASEQFFRKAWFGADARSMPALGTKESIGAMKREDVVAYYHAYYRPERMVLLLAGDFERGKALELLEKTFGAGAAPGPQGAAAPRDPNLTPAMLAAAGEPKAAPPKSGFYRQRIGGERGYLRIGMPAPGAGQEDAAVLRAIAGLLGSGAGSRLGRALAGSDQQLAIDASADFSPGRGVGIFQVAATLPADSDGVEAIKAIRAELGRLAAEPVPADELRAIVTEERANMLYLRDQVHYLGMQVAHDLILGERPSVGAEAGALSVVTPALVQEAARRWFNGPVVAALSSPSVPEGTDPAKPVPIPAPDAGAGAPGKGTGAMAGAGAAAAAAGGRARAIRRIDFENGLTLVVAENPDSDIFAAHVLVRDRAAMEPAGKDGIADLLHRTLPYGSLFLDGEGITQKLRTLGARLKTVDDAGIPYDDYYNSPRYSYARFETIRENWREGLGLLFALIAYPRLEDKDIALAASEEIDLARRGQETPRALARALYAKTLLKDGPLARPIAGTPVTIASIRAEDLRAFHARYFSPDQLILSIVSNVNASDVAEVVRATFGAMKPGPGAPALAPLKPGEERHRVSALADPPATEAAVKVEVKGGKEQSQLFVGGIFARAEKDLAPLIVATTVMSTALAQDLRETKGLAYSVGCSLEDYGGKAWFTAQMGTRPDNVDTAEASIREAIRKFGESEQPQAAIERAVNAMRGQMAMRRMTRISQAYSLGFNEFLGRGTDFDAKLDAALAAVTPAEIQRVAKRYLDPDRMVTAIAR